MNIFNTIKIKKCDSFIKKLVGFSFKKKNINYGLLFEKVNSIQTFFMFQKIDIIMTDKEYKILYLFNSFKPFKVILPKKNVYYTFELPNNFINNKKYYIGQYINK